MKHIQKSLLLERNLAGGLEGGAGSAESSSVTPQEVLDKEFYNSLTKESQKALSRVLKGSQIQKIKNGEQAVRLNSVLKMGFIPERKAVVQEAKVAQQDHRSEVGEAKVVTLSDNDNASYESSEVQSGNVEALQTLIGTKVDGDWGANSQRALNAYLKKGKNAVKDVQRIIGTKADGAWGPNSRAQLTAFIDGGSAEGGHSELGKEVITQLKDIQEYLDAYNRVYGEQKEDGKVKLFSNNKGLLGIANKVVSPNYKKLAGELGVTNNQVQEITGDKGINKAGLTRFATIAVVSAFVSGGSSVALELFGINVGKDFHKGPEVQKILKLMDSRGDLDANMRELIISDEATSKDVTGVLDELNNPSLLPANLRRQLKGLFVNDGYAFLTGGLKDKKRIEKLIDTFEDTNDTEGAKQILLEIYKVALKRLKTVEKRVGKSKIWEKRTNEIKESLKNVGIESGRITSLDAKYDSIVGNDTSAERAATAKTVAEEIGYTDELTSISASKLDSQNAYGFELPKNPTPEQLGELLTRMESTKVAGDKHSILTHVIAGVRTHTGRPISVADFKKGFTSMRSLNAKEMASINKNIESNTGRTLEASFQGEVSSDNITAMEVNGSTIYFRGECTNVLTVNEPLQTTITSAKSIPVAIPVSLGGGNAPEGLVNSSRPELEGDATDIFSPRRIF